MAIDPYEPELAKRQRAFQLATKQLTELVNLNTQVSNQGKPDFIDQFNHSIEALRDYEHYGRELAEWLAQKR
jgi:predicted transglutaminase-like cysteine proteinase